MAASAFSNIHGSMCSEGPTPLPDGGLRMLIGDLDQRRSVDVHAPKGVERRAIVRATAKFLDTLPANVVKVNISADGELLSTSTDPNDDSSWVPFYPRRSDFPAHVATLRRGDLTEIGRLSCLSDLVTYSQKTGETKKAVFRFYHDVADVAGRWHEMNCVLRIPRHPNIVPFEALVVDTVGGVDRVVGYTVAHVAGELLSLNMGQMFKLKYLKQLIELVDHLNLNLGIVHGGVSAYSLYIDPETDNIQLEDFLEAARLGWEGDEEYGVFKYDKRRNDVKFTILTVYDIITRELRLCEDFRDPRRLDAATFLRKQNWKKHRHAKLDSPADEYRRVLSAWANRRAKTDRRIDHFSKASAPLSWPPLAVDPDMVDNSRGMSDPDGYAES